MQYLLDKYRHVGPSLLADTPEDRAIGNLVARIHDVYIAPIQVGYKYIQITESPHQRFLCESIGI
jgi:hypothetical protein